MTEFTFGNSAMLARLERVAAFSVRRAGLVIVLSLVLAVAGAVYTARNIGISTDTAEMLSASLDWRIAYDEFKREFPYFSDTIVVVVDAATPELARETASAIAAKAQTSPHFEAVFNPLDSPFLKRNQLLYLAVDDLESLTNDIAGSQAILGSLAAEPSLVKLFDLLNQIMTRDDTTPDSGRFVDTIARAIGEVLNGNDVPMSWQNLMRSEAVDDAVRLVFTVTPKLDYTEILPAKPAMNALHSYIAELDLGSSVSVRLTGAAALAHDELSAVIRGAEQAAILALAMVAACLIVGLRSGSLVVATLLTLCTGLVLTASAACLLVGKLNMISVAFAVLYVGLGVDFAIHVGLRYRELCGELSKNRAVIYATSHIGESILLCAITTAIAFFAFMPTEYRGVAELGLISGVGMLIALATTFTLLPALLSYLPSPRAARPASTYEPGAGKRIPAGAILTATTLLTAAAALTLPGIQFDLNPLHLNDQSAESVLTLRALAEDGEQPLHSVSVLTHDPDAGRRLAEALKSNDRVDSVTTINDLVPRAQAEKLQMIDDLYWALGGPIAAGVRTSVDETAAFEALAHLKSTLLGDRATTPFLSYVVRLQSALRTGTEEDRAALLASLDTKLLKNFLPQIEQLNHALEPRSFDHSELPQDLAQRWQSAGGYSRIEIQPGLDLDDNAELVAFVESVRSHAGSTLTGTPVINLEASRAVINAFAQAFITAGILISMVLWFVLRKPAEVMICLAPILLAGLFTTAICVTAGIAFNFANIIALPLLLGIGVDSALHIVHRYKHPGDDQRPLLRSSTARAVLFSALTTAASFGNLAVSPHDGTASMGVMLSIGLAMTLICMLVVLPALLDRFINVEEVW